MLDQRLLGVGVDPRVDRLVADRAALGVGRIIHRSHCATCLHAQASADLAGRAPLRQIKDHAAAENLIAVQEPLLRAAPGHLRCSPGILGLVHAARTPMAGDFTAHHRGATPNQVGDTRLGQARLQPRHDRRAILNTQHPTTPHDQPPNSITATRKLLTPYDTAKSQITRMRALVEQTRQEQEAAIASLRQQHAQYATQLAQEQAAAEKRLRDINKEVERNEAKLARVTAKTVEQKEELRALGIRYDEGIKMLDVGWTDYESPAASSVALKGQLDEVRATIKEMIRTGAAVDASETFTFNDSKVKGRKFVRDMAKMMLRAYNAEAENCVLTVKAGNGNVARNRLERARDQIVKLGALINLQINFHYHRLRIKELELTLQY